MKRETLVFLVFFMIFANGNALRSAEKSRASTCSFADEIALKSIALYKELCPIDLLENTQQTVLAAIVLQIPIDFSDDTIHINAKKDTIQHNQYDLRVVSLAVSRFFFFFFNSNAPIFLFNTFFRQGPRSCELMISIKLARDCTLHNYVPNLLISMMVAMIFCETVTLKFWPEEPSKLS
jgi:hypothetical protein